jgi:hypothetical protein
LFITISDALKLPSLREGEVVAGLGGLNRRIHRVSVCECPDLPIDLEIIGKENLLFVEGEFLITSFYALKDSRDLLLDTIKLYNKYNSSGICIVKRYFKEIDKSVIDYANKVNYPIIMIRRDIPYADIIMDVSKALLSNQDIQINISILNDILNENNTKEEIVSLAYRLNPRFLENISVLCISFDKYDESKAKYLMSLFENRPDTFLTLYYNYILMFVYSDNKISKEEMDRNVKRMTAILDSQVSKYNIGISNSFEKLYQIKAAIEQSISSCKVSKFEDSKTELYNQIGTYKLLMTIKENEILKTFYEEFMQPLIEYDSNKKGDLVKTLLLYIKHKGNIKSMAKESFQHENTIRYRVFKIKELLGFEDREFEFFENICMIYKISKILKM